MPEKEIDTKNDSGMEIPDYAIEAIARSLLPIIQHIMKAMWASGIWQNGKLSKPQSANSTK